MKAKKNIDKEKLLATKLARRLQFCGLAKVDELRFISEAEFRRVPYVGDSLVNYAKAQLAKSGLAFGRMTLDQYRERRMRNCSMRVDDYKQAFIELLEKMEAELGCCKSVSLRKEESVTKTMYGDFMAAKAVCEICF